jgi:hypothetical protein
MPFTSGSSGTYNNHLHIVFCNESGNSIKVADTEIYISAAELGTGIARSNEKFAAKGALVNFPCQGMFAPTRA